jgi:hypothetical protein
MRRPPSFLTSAASQFATWRALGAISCLTASSLAQAHFVFVLPNQEGTQARVILSETLEVDEDIDPELVDGVKLVTRDGAGAEGALALARDGETRLVKLPEKARGAIHGTLTHGVMKHGPKPFLVVYHPKACLGYPFGSAARIGAESPAEIVPAGHPGAVRFQLLSRGEPVADAKLIVLLPDGKQQEVVTDTKGHTPVFHAAGRYGAWARHVVATPGAHGGEAYVEERHYPTIVMDVPAGHKGAAKDTHATFTKTEKLPALPVAASSLGAVASNGHVYVYGGHIAPVHTYSTEAVSGRFFRRPLSGGGDWEELANGPPRRSRRQDLPRGRHGSTQQAGRSGGELLGGIGRLLQPGHEHVDRPAAYPGAAVEPRRGGGRRHALRGRRLEHARPRRGGLVRHDARD